MPTNPNLCPHPPATPDTSLPGSLHRPRPGVPKALPFELPRPDLLSRLNTGARIVFLIAPSGFGKTTLLADWARKHSGRHVWFEVKGEDQEPATLLADLARAVLLSGVALPSWSALTCGGTQETRLGALLEDLNASPEDVTLIIDRSECLSEDAAVLLNDVLLGLGDGHRALIAQHAGGHLSPLPFLTGGHAQTIDIAQLTFSAQDTQTLAGQFPDVRADLALKIYDENAGWPLGTVLGLHRPTPSHLSAPLEVLSRLVARLPAALQQNIAGLAVLDLWNEHEAQRAGLTLPDGWLREVLKVGLPLTPQDDGLVPHALVRHYLSVRLHAQPDVSHALHRHWAGQEQLRNRPHSAIHHYLLAKTPDLAARLAESLGPRWRRAKNWKVVTETLGTLPQDQLSPALLALLALAHTETGETEKATSLLGGLQDEEQTPLGLIVLAQMAQQHGRLDDAYRHVQRGLLLPAEEVDTIGLLQLRARIHATRGQPEIAVQDAQNAMQRATRLGETEVRIESLGTLGAVYSRTGRTDEAISTFELTVEMGLQSGYVNRVFGSINYLKNQYLSMGRVQQTDLLFRRYLEAARTSAPRGVVAAEMTLGHLLFVQGQVEEARALLQASFDTFLEQSNYASASAAFNPLLDLLLETGQQGAGRRLWQQLYGFLVVDHDPWERVNKMNSDALLLHAEGHFARARTEALEAVRLAADISPVKLFQTELLLLDLKRLTDTLHYKDLLELSSYYEADPDYHLDVLQTWRIYAAVLTCSRSRHWDVPLFTLVAERQERERPTGETRPCLQVRTLGDFQVMIGETPLVLTSPAHEEILAYLAVHALTPDLLQQDEIAMAIWDYDDSELKRARHSLQTARTGINKAVRNALGGELVSSGGRGRENTTWRLSPVVSVRCDALDLLQITDPAEAARLAPQAETFLIHRRSEWVQGVRRRLAAHLAQVLTQSAGETEHRDPETALGWLISAANLAPTPEAFRAIERFGARQRGGPLAEIAALTVRQAAEGQPLTFTHQRALN